MSPLITIRLARIMDVTDIYNIDTKSYLYPWDAELWYKLVGDRDVSILAACYYGTLIGFAAIRLEKKEAYLGKLAVSPLYRNRGIGTYLMERSIEHAAQFKMPTIYTIVPESSLPEGPENQSKFLTDMGFKAVTPLVKDVYSIYGNVEDGVRFEKEVMGCG